MGSVFAASSGRGRTVVFASDIFDFEPKNDKADSREDRKVLVLSFRAGSVSDGQEPRR